MRRFIVGSLFACAVCGCGTSGSLRFATPTPTETATPTPTPDPCTVPGTVCAVGVPDDGDGGSALSASLSWPYEIARDPDGNVYVAETFGHRIRKIDTAGVVTTLAGTGKYEWPVPTGLPAEETPVLYPTSVAAAADGWVYWTGWDEAVIYGRDPSSGDVVVVAGDGSWDAGADGPATGVPAYLSWEAAMSADAQGNLFLADMNDHVVRVLNRQATDITVAGVLIAPGWMETIAGTGSPGTGANGVQAVASALDEPIHALPMADGTVLIAEHGNNRIRRIATDGVITTIAGNGAAGSGGDGNAALSASFNGPSGIAADANGRIFVTDHSLRMRMVNLTGALAIWGGVTIAAGNVDTVAGSGDWAYFVELDGTSALDQAMSWDHGHPILETNGDVLLPDTWTATLRRVSAANGTMAVASGLAGQTSVAGYQQWVDGLAFRQSGELIYSGGTPYLFRIDPATSERSTFAGTGSLDPTGDGGPVSAAGVYADSIAVLADGSLVLTDSWNMLIRRIDAGGTITTIAGTGAYALGGAGDGGLATAAAFDSCEAVAADAQGNLFVLDNDQIRFINRGTSDVTIAGVLVAAGEIDRIAGTGDTPGDSGDGALARNALLDADYQSHLLVADGALFLSDFRNHRIRRIDLTTGTITTFAGNGIEGYRGDGDVPANAWVGSPTGLATKDGYLYWAQEDGAVIRRTLLTGAGPVETIAGSGSEGFAEHGVPATETSFLWPTTLAFSPDGTLYFGDGTKRVFRLIVP